MGNGERCDEVTWEVRSSQGSNGQEEREEKAHGEHFSSPGADLWWRSLVPISGADLWCQSPGPNIWCQSLVPISWCWSLNHWCSARPLLSSHTGFRLLHPDLTCWFATTNPCANLSIQASNYPGFQVTPTPPPHPIRCKQILWKSWFDLLPRDNQSALVQQCCIQCDWTRKFMKWLGSRGLWFPKVRNVITCKHKSLLSSTLCVV